MIENNKITGLTDSQVTDSRRDNGWNILTPAKKTPLWRLYLEKYQDPIIQILLVAAMISLVLAVIEHQYVETVGIFVAIFLATTVGFVFEMDAAKKFDVLTQLNEDQKVKVIRNGQVMLVSRKEVVVGDVVVVETGDEIPADGILHEAVSLQVDESMLTGEPITSKEAEPRNDGTADEATYERNMVLRSTMVMNGRGVFFVTAVGDATEIGKVARTSSEKTDVKTPLGLQLDRLGSFINKFGFSLSILASVLFLGHDILVNPLWRTIGQADADYVQMFSIVMKYFMMAVTLIVMAVPEGLPMAVTLALALNMRRMLKSNNLVRKLHACETMGAVTVICTDKTGTLTQNRMQVAASPNISKDEEQMLAQSIAVNTTADLDENGKGIGNPTEVALLLWVKQRGYDYRALRSAADIISQEPFSTETKQMKTVVRGCGNTEIRNCGNTEIRNHGNTEIRNHGITEVRNYGGTESSEVIYIKGAPEIVLAQCNLSAEQRQELDAELLRYQKKAMRTLAVAITNQSSGQTAGAYIFGISDPIRPDVAGAVRQCNDAGITVKVVTGDVSTTALEIARQSGIIEDDEDATGLTITGSDFMALSDDDAMECAKHLRVMSRARPQDKQRLVQLLQKQGEVVAVTGDGTNDAPALNYAHVGLSLGSGTNVAKEASDMTLLDDSFASIVNAVMWGRSLYKNIQRFLFFQLVVNICALLLVIAGSVVGTEMPLTVTQILWVNLIMDTFAALALSSLPPSREVMSEKPRKQTDFILTRGIVHGILSTGLLLFLVMFAFLLWCERDEHISVHELTWFFTTFVMLQTWNLFNARCIGSHHSALRRLWAAKGFTMVLLFILIGQVLIVQFGGDMFRCEPLSLAEWVTIILATSPVLFLGEAYRLIRK